MKDIKNNRSSVRLSDKHQQIWNRIYSFRPRITVSELMDAMTDQKLYDQMTIVFLAIEAIDNGQNVNKNCERLGNALKKIHAMKK